MVLCLVLHLCWVLAVVVIVIVVLVLIVYGRLHLAMELILCLILGLILGLRLKLDLPDSRSLSIGVGDLGAFAEDVCRETVRPTFGELRDWVSTYTKMRTLQINTHNLTASFASVLVPVALIVQLGSSFKELENQRIRFSPHVRIWPAQFSVSAHADSPRGV